MLMVDDLLRYEAGTRPPGNEEAIHKGANARRALEGAGEILGHAIRWAVMHKVGLALHRGPYVPSAPLLTDLMYDATHEHEIAGASWPEDDTATIRDALADVIQGVLGFWKPA